MVGLWGVVNNAGVNFPGDVELLTMDQYKKVAEINLYGGIRILKTFLPMIRKSTGKYYLSFYQNTVNLELQLWMTRGKRMSE